jgi:flagellar motor protein MotB
MSDLSDILQGKLQNRKVHIKDQNGRQLDLFSSLSERSPAATKIVPPAPEPLTKTSPEPELVLPPAGTPPDVSADVRAVLSESGPGRRIEAASLSGDPENSLRTGIYHRPRRPVVPPAPPPAPAPPPKSAVERSLLFRGIRDWFAGVEMDRRHISLVVVLTVLVALIAFWTACPRQDEASPDVTVDLQDIHPDSPPSSAAVAPPAVRPVAVAPAAPAPQPAAATPVAPTAPAGDWKIAGTQAIPAGGAMLIRFNDPVFVSADKISIEGMAALKAVAAKLVLLKSGGRVIVTGYTDNVPLSNPTPQFKSNADLAAARAKVAVEHLSQFARANKRLAFEARTGASAEAPYPNDTLQNRRLNRTVTVQVISAP